MSAIIAYTDASVQDNHLAQSGQAAYAVHFPLVNGYDRCGKISGTPGSSKAELHAMIQAVLIAKQIDETDSKELHIYSDSQNAVEEVNRRGIDVAGRRKVTAFKCGSHGSAPAAQRVAHELAGRAARS